MYYAQHIIKCNLTELKQFPVTEFRLHLESQESMLGLKLQLHNCLGDGMTLASQDKFPAPAVQKIQLKEPSIHVKLRILHPDIVLQRLKPFVPHL